MASGDDTNWAKYTTLGFEMAGAIGLCAFLGWAADRHFHWTPWGVTVGSLVGVAAGMYVLLRQALQMNKD